MTNHSSRSLSLCLVVLAVSQCVNVLIVLGFATGSGAMVRTLTPILAVVAQGILLGQIGLLSVIAGLLTRSWLGAFLLAVAIAYMLVASYLLPLSLGTQNGMLFTFASTAFSMTPPCLFACCLPFLLMRVFRGMALATSEESDCQPERMTIESIFLTTTVVACLLMMQGSAYSSFPIDRARGFLAFAAYALGLFLASLTCPLPITVYYFSAPNEESAVNRLLAAGGVTVAAFLAVTAGLLALFAPGGGSDSLEVCGYVIAASLTAFCTFAFGLASLRLSGYKLLGPNRQLESALAASESTTIDPFADDRTPSDSSVNCQGAPAVNKPRTASRRWADWTYAGCFVLLAIVASLLSYLRD